MKLKDFQAQTSGLSPETELFILSPNGSPHETTLSVRGLGVQGEIVRCFLQAGPIPDWNEDVGDLETGDTSDLGPTEEELSREELRASETPAKKTAPVNENAGSKEAIKSGTGAAQPQTPQPKK